jgi:hypothetical protein
MSCRPFKTIGSEDMFTCSIILVFSSWQEAINDDHVQAFVMFQKINSSTHSRYVTVPSRGDSYRT